MAEFKTAVGERMAETEAARKKRLAREKQNKPWRTVNRHWFELYENIYDRVEEDQKWTAKEIVLVNKMIKAYGVDKVLEMVTRFFDETVHKAKSTVPSVALMWAKRDTLSKSMDMKTPADEKRKKILERYGSSDWGKK